jgi:hypothetical protein
VLDCGDVAEWRGELVAGQPARDHVDESERCREREDRVLDEQWVELDAVCVLDGERRELRLDGPEHAVAELQGKDQFDDRHPVL